MHCIHFFSEVNYRYDGIVRGNQEQSHNPGILKKALKSAVNYLTGNEKNDQKLLRNDAEYAIKIYTSLLKLDSFGSEDIEKPFMEILNIILQNLRRRYFLEECLWSYADDFDKFAGKVCLYF